jgi:hypothetical protein
MQERPAGISNISARHLVKKEPFCRKAMGRFRRGGAERLENC